MKTIGGKIDSLLRETHGVIEEYSGELGSEFGMDEVMAPTRLEEILPTVILTTPDGLSNIVKTIRREILYDTGMVLDLLRKPLRTLQDAFHRLDLDQYLQPVEDEDSLKDWPQANEDDERCAIACKDICKRIEYQMTQVHTQRNLFIKALEEAGRSSHEGRLHMGQEVLRALGDHPVPIIGENLDERVRSVCLIALEGWDFDDQNARTALFRRIRGFLFPICGKKAFDVFASLDECVEYARLRHDDTDW